MEVVWIGRVTRGSVVAADFDFFFPYFFPFLLRRSFVYFVK